MFALYALLLNLGLLISLALVRLWYKSVSESYARLGHAC